MDTESQKIDPKQKRQGTGPARFVSTRVSTLPVGTHSDPGQVGLQLRVRKNRRGFTRSWLLRFKFRGEEARILIGHFPETSLDAARGRARQLRELAAQGIDPRKATSRRIDTNSRRQTVGTDAKPTDKHSVEFLVDEFVERHLKTTRKRPDYAVNILNRDILPVWKGRDARTIEPAEVIDLLDGIVARGSNVMANRVAAILTQMFKFAIHRRIVPTSPVQLLYRPGGKEKPRERALSDDELRVFLASERVFKSAPIWHALMVLLLTMQRRSEVALAEWKQIDFDKKTWTIPDELAKAGKGHVVPLTDWAVEEFLELKKLAGKSKFVFPTDDGESSAEGKLITRSVARCQDQLNKLGMEKWTPHDLRRTGRTGLARLKVAPHIAERVLNHAQDRIPGTYDVHDYADEKRAALEQWEAKVKALKTAGMPEKRKPE